MILVLDFGSQYTQLIARRVRSLNVFSRILPCSASVEEVRAHSPEGIILSGGPASVYAADAPQLNPGLLELGVPILGICYGMQALAHTLGGKVTGADSREYGAMEITPLGSNGLLDSVSSPTRVWMSHGDRVEELPAGFRVIAHSENAPVAAMGDSSRRIYGIQFHPEVVHTVEGNTILMNYLFRICESRPDWTMESFVDQTVVELRERVGDRSVLCAVSGGVDSTVLAVLLHRAVKDQLRCLFVDNGLLRKGEGEVVPRRFRDLLGMEIETIRAGDRFLERLAGVSDPEEKRRRIGREFVDVFFEAAGDFDFLAQGTLYPDVIETTSTRGPSATIKTHHNRVPEILRLIEEDRVIEPLQELFKDEVRGVGAELGIPAEVVNRHPFPGPGLAVRMVGEVTPERLQRLREADAVVIEEMRASGWYDKVWQAFAVLLPVRSVGVMGDERTYENVVAIRVVESRDAMTADWARLPENVLARMANRIINEVRGINRVVYDISSKPPSTIEWE